MIILLSLIWSLVEVHSQTAYVSFKGVNLTNNAYVDLTTVGDDITDPGNTVRCHSDLTSCCTSSVGDHRGSWFFPGGSILQLAGTNDDIVMDREPQEVHIRRRNNAMSPTGIYRCDIETMAVNDNDVDTITEETVYVGLYPPNEGDIIISDDITLSGLNRASPQFTLTCISTSGPATTVTWTRYSGDAVGVTEIVLNDPVTAQYTHTLTVTGRLVGLYTCTVTNDKPSTASATITVEVANTPTNLNAVVNDNLTSVLLTWDPPSPLGDTSGYRVDYTNGRDSGSININNGSDEYVLFGLENRTTYNISILGTSNHFFSETITITVELIEEESDRGGGGSDNAGAVVAGVLVPLFVIIIIIIVVVVILILWKKWYRIKQYFTHRKSSGSTYIRSSPARPPAPNKPAPPIQYQKTQDTVKYKPNAPPRPNGKAPVIMKFPEDMYISEGEGVLFRVEVTGSPQPKMTWYHDGQEVKSDYSMELGDDGSLTMPSTETKHSGVYQLVARNKVGSVEREVKLFVKKEGAPSPYVARKHITFSPIPLDQFGEYVAQCHANDNREFRDHYTELDKDTDHPITIGTDPNLKLLNRFANITVYDDNRIILRPIEGHPDCQREFINACYVDGYKIRNKFIATQGPLPKTVVDLWRLVWQEKPLTIVMVTNLKEGTKIKCQQYWPETGTKNFGPFQVTISDEQKLADFTTRTLLVELKGSSERALKVTQFHFTAWPDHGVPDYATPILAFHKKIKKQHRPSKGPMLIHCSAGVGRTGTLITIDRVLDQIEKEKVVDIAGVIQHLRHQRMKMVQNVEQYIFINDAILESVTCGDTQITASDLRRAIQILSRQDPQTRLTGFENQFKVLDQVSPKPDEIQREKALENPTKNRNEDFLPGDRWRVVLKGEVEDYIHAVVVNGYKQQRAFIIAQSPMKSTARDFWKMIYDRKCGVIVMLCDLVENEKDVCHQYWPDSGKMQVGGFTVELLGEEKLEGFIICTFSVFHKKSNKVQQVYQIRMTNWSPDGHCSNLTGITDTIAEVTKIQQRTGNHPILVHCSDTVSRSGMFCAITTTIERCKTEQVVDVFQVVKALRVQKPGAVQTVAQFHTLFETVLVYLDSFDTYGNFRDL